MGWNELPGTGGMPERKPEAAWRALPAVVALSEAVQALRSTGQRVELTKRPGGFGVSIRPGVAAPGNGDQARRQLELLGEIAERLEDARDDLARLEAAGVRVVPAGRGSFWA